ncbi:MAG: dUTP diphosphatase [Clostridiales bacterium]|nr:dUTP diphosphatase [Clostridiales bacterium]
MMVKVKKLSSEAVLPHRATEYSAGADLHACIPAAITIAPGETVKIGTGIALETPVGYAAFLYGRSGLGVKHGIAPANCVGVCDSDYRGEVIIGLHNHSQEPFIIQPNDRIAQVVIAPILEVEFQEAEELSDTQRGSGGFGSTGISQKRIGGEPG